MSISQSIRSSSKWLVGSNLVSQILQFAFGIALARLLVPADFGLIVTIQIFTGFASLIASGGLGQSLIRTKDVSDADFHVVFSVQIAVGILIYFIFFMIAPYFSVWFGSAIYCDLLRVSAVSFLIRPFINQHVTWLHRNMRFQDTSKIALASATAAGFSSIVMAASGLGVWSLVLSGILGSFTTALMVMRLTPIRVRLLLDGAIARRHSRFGLKMTANDFISYLRNQTSNFIITKMAGPAMVGLFNKGDSLAKLPFQAISGPIYQPVFRSMSAEQDNPDKIKYMFFRMISLLTLYTLPLYVGLFWLAEPFVVTLYGERWIDAAIPLQILAPLGILYCIGHPCGAVLAATNRVGREVVVQMVTWAIAGIGCYVGLQWGLAGVATAIVLSQVYSTTHMYLLANGFVRARFMELATAVGPGAVLNILMLGALMLVDEVLPAGFREQSRLTYLLLSFVVGAGVYGAAFLFIPLRPIGDEALRWRRLLRLST